MVLDIPRSQALSLTNNYKFEIEFRETDGVYGYLFYQLSKVIKKVATVFHNVRLVSKKTKAILLTSPLELQIV